MRLKERGENLAAEKAGVYMVKLISSSESKKGIVAIFGDNELSVVLCRACFPLLS